MYINYKNNLQIYLSDFFQKLKFEQPPYLLYSIFLITDYLYLFIKNSFIKIYTINLKTIYTKTKLKLKKNLKFLFFDNNKKLSQKKKFNQKTNKKREIQKTNKKNIKCKSNSKYQKTIKIQIFYKTTVQIPKTLKQPNTNKPVEDFQILQRPLQQINPYKQKEHLLQQQNFSKPQTINNNKQNKTLATLTINYKKKVKYNIQILTLKFLTIKATAQPTINRKSSPYIIIAAVFFLENNNNPHQQYQIDSSKISSRSYGIIKAYAANTNNGIFRNYNEDRVSIILSVSKPSNKQTEYWAKTSFFAIYDGHGGSNCADYLRDNLHLFIIKDDFFPENPIEAIKRGIYYAEQSFLKMAEETNDRSGSCAIILLIMDDMAYVANIGDSRAILSMKNGQIISNLSQDHKPEFEKERIEAAGGNIYYNYNCGLLQGMQIQPPCRVFPGKLSVSRTIGDIQAKNVLLGGNPNVIISNPDIKQLKITNEHDFILLGCDGIFDRINSQNVANIFWNSINEQKLEPDFHKQCGKCIEQVMIESFDRKSFDNITLVAISFENLNNYFNQLQQIQQQQQQLQIKSQININNHNFNNYQQYQSLPQKSSDNKVQQKIIIQHQIHLRIMFKNLLQILLLQVVVLKVFYKEVKNIIKTNNNIFMVNNIRYCNNKFNKNNQSKLKIKNMIIYQIIFKIFKVKNNIYYILVKIFILIIYIYIFIFYLFYIIFILHLYYNIIYYIQQQIIHIILNLKYILKTTYQFYNITLFIYLFLQKIIKDIIQNQSILRILIFIFFIPQFFFKKKKKKKTKKIFKFFLV
ncbi:protein phosphatase 2c, putative [Ichthyophthirius multifiliis]|uniref:protein-serine/threonine phosphatase n=1 Tax=Ichthyophthirius multifiliis TaxID=5932 RepID=G0QYA1_ICHMU|nr:protein phosphatase 2c, putative [Ichthyophthirius multifiliis]EGR29805.1 protein phosphatase 2c, putative [Ichthyophthirius multifiliis]|eukprot:XP_004031041.1 protein phosphatase 2c, putative [Ichthyophthirius multifiliis]